MEISLEVGEGKGETDFLKQGNCGGAEVVDVKELYVAGCGVVMWGGCVDVSFLGCFLFFSFLYYGIIKVILFLIHRT